MPDIILVCISSMVVMRRFEDRSGSRSRAGSQDRPALTKDRARQIIREGVIEIVRGQIPEVFGSTKTAMVEYFDKRYAAIAEMATAPASAVVGGRGRSYRIG